MSTTGKSVSQLTTATAKLKKTVTADANRISSAKSDITAAKKKIDEYNDYLAKTNGYNSLKAAYENYTDQINAKNKKLGATKKSSEKKSLTKDIKDLTAKRKAIYASMKKLSSSKTYQAELAKYHKAQTTILNADNRVANWTAVKTTDNKKYTTSKNALTKAKNKATKKKQKKNSAAIQKKIKAAQKAGFQGHTAIYREDLATSRVFMFSEYSPSETNDQDVPTYAIDTADPRSNYSVRTSKQLSGTYYLHGKDFKSIDDQYEILQGWARKDVRVVVRGFSRWAHAYLQSVGKQGDNAYHNALALSITFQYGMEDSIEVVKKKSKKKSKAKAGTKKGSSKSKARYVFVKAGSSLASIAKKQGFSYSELKKLNSHFTKKTTKVRIA